MMRSESSPATRAGGGNRGQVVLIAAIALAVALVPLVLAYLQLGYSADVRPGSATGPGAETTRTLDRGLQNATAEIPAAYGWAARERAAATVRDRLNGTLAAIERSRLSDGTTVVVTYNESHTAAWLSANCPGGPNRQFGACRMVNGIAVQERGGRTHVLGTAFDVVVTAPQTELRITTVTET
jgi:hypothetical protein